MEFKTKQLYSVERKVIPERNKALYNSKYMTLSSFSQLGLKLSFESCAVIR